MPALLWLFLAPYIAPEAFSLVLAPSSFLPPCCLLPVANSLLPSPYSLHPSPYPLIPSHLPPLPPFSPIPFSLWWPQLMWLPSQASERWVVSVSMWTKQMAWRCNVVVCVMRWDGVGIKWDLKTISSTSATDAYIGSTKQSHCHHLEMYSDPVLR